MSKDLELEKALVPYGYSMMFSSRDSVEEAFTYVNEIGRARPTACHVITACMVYSNTLIKALHQNGKLNMDVASDLEMMTKDRDRLLKRGAEMHAALKQIADDSVNICSESNPHAHLFTRIAKEALAAGVKT